MIEPTVTEPARECWCMAKGREVCTCDVPFIGSWAWADKRIADGTLRSLEAADVTAAIQADWEAHAPHLMALPLAAPEVQSSSNA